MTLEEMQRYYANQLGAGQAFGNALQELGQLAANGGQSLNYPTSQPVAHGNALQELGRLSAQSLNYPTSQPVAQPPGAIGPNVLLLLEDDVS